MTFEEYVKAAITISDCDIEPFCPICSAYCDAAYQYEECIKCEFAKEGYERNDN